ncbi:LytR/AlgR family response regulator transcription factor [Clostridium paraputrificum]|uniref:LytR/AlgR family response regulator transcription factor n=1 Tax=Clostridium TaxID=1485 RepID=UPI003D32716B
MLKIYIIEDDNRQREELTKYINDTIEEEGLDLEIALSTVDPKELLCSVEDDGKTGIYFIDLDLGMDIHGIELAELIRKYDKNGFIIFVTGHGELSFLTIKYKVGAMEYIQKGNIEVKNRKIRECLIKINDKQNCKKDMDIISIKSREKVIEFDRKNIMFFEESSNPNKVIAHAMNRQMEFFGTLKDIDKEVSGDFLRLNKSAIVNINNIKDINKIKKTIVMRNGEIILLGFIGFSKAYKILRKREL